MNKDYIKTMQNTINECDARMSALRKFKPFFEVDRLNNYSQKYKEYDMGVICMAFISFMFYEGKLKSRDLTFDDLNEFLGEIVENFYGQRLESEEIKEFTSYCIDKMGNDGFGYECNHYSPIEKKVDDRGNSVRYIESAFNQKTEGFNYYLTTEAIDFFLQTKEFGEESKVTIHLLLLKKLIENSEYESALITLNNVCAEVIKQISMVFDIESVLLYGGKSGYEAYIKYIETGNKRFLDEKVLFAETVQEITNLREGYADKVSKEELGEKEMNAMICLDMMDIELKRVVEIHQKLLKTIGMLTKRAGEIQRGNMANLLKVNFNFSIFLDSVAKKNDASILSGFVLPLLNMNIKKTFPLEKIDDMLLLNNIPDAEETITDAIDDEVLEERILFKDELRERVIANYAHIFEIIYSQLTDKESIDIEFLIRADNVDHNTVLNPDFVSFIVDMKRNTKADVLSKMQKSDDKPNLIDAAMERFRQSNAGNKYDSRKLGIKVLRNEYIEISDGFEITNVEFTLIR